MTWVDARPKARKTHRCDLCCRAIRPGETYRRGVNFDEGTAYTWKECAHCEALVRDFDIDYWGDGYNDDTIVNWSPSTVDGLRAKVNYGRRWTRRDGSLVEVPA